MNALDGPTSPTVPSARPVHQWPLVEVVPDETPTTRELADRAVDESQAVDYAPHTPAPGPEGTLVVDGRDESPEPSSGRTYPDR